MFGRLSTREIALLAQRTIEDHVQSCEKKWQAADDKMGGVDRKLDTFLQAQQRFERKVFFGLLGVLVSILGVILVESFHFNVTVGNNQTMQRIITESTRIAPVPPKPPEPSR